VLFILFCDVFISLSVMMMIIFFKSSKGSTHTERKGFFFDFSFDTFGFIPLGFLYISFY